MIFTWWQARRQAEATLRAAEHQAFLDALKAVVAISTAQADATRELAQVLHEWLTMFKVPNGEAPTTWVNTDLTELIREQERNEALREQGYPIELDAAGQAQWVAAQMERING